MSTTDLDATHYTQHSSLQNGHANEILSTLRIDPRSFILDVGCGDGRNTAELAARAQQGRVIGLDISPSMIEFASENFPQESFPNLRFQLSSIENAVFDHPFNIITSFSCFHWLKEPKKVIQKLALSLKEGGELLILTYPKESPYYQYLETVLALEKYSKYKHLSANRTMLSAQEYQDFFQENQFNILSFEKTTIPATYNNAEEIYNFIKGWVNNYAPLPEDLQDAFIHDIVQAILNDPSTQNGSVISVPYTALVMRVQKR